MKKKILAILLTTILSLSFSMTALAEENTKAPDNSTITQSAIDNPIVTPRTVDVGYINADGVRLRASAGLSGTVLASLYTGDSIAITNNSVSKDGYLWRYVEVDRLGISGWVADLYITFTEA